MTSVVEVNFQPKYSGGVIAAADMAAIRDFYLLANARFIKGIQNHKLSRSARPIWPRGYAILAAPYAEKKDMLAAGRSYYAGLYTAFHDTCGRNAPPNYLNALPCDLRHMVADFLIVVANTDTKCSVTMLGVPHDIGLPYVIKTRLDGLHAKWLNGTTVVANAQPMAAQHVAVARIADGRIICSCNKPKFPVLILGMLRPCPCGKTRPATTDGLIVLAKCCNACGTDTINYSEYRTRLFNSQSRLAAISFDFQHLFMSGGTTDVNKSPPVFGQGPTARRC